MRLGWMALALILIAGCTTVVHQPPTIVIFDVMPIDPPQVELSDCYAFMRDGLACDALLEI